jgi:hypothetical protein
VEEIGKNSVSPSTIAIIIASKKLMIIVYPARLIKKAAPLLYRPIVFKLLTA